MTEKSASLYERYKDALRRGHVAALRNRLDAAVMAYDEAATIAPDRALPHTSIGGILVRMNRLEDAVAAYDRAIALAPRDEGALQGQSEVLVRLGRRTEAAGALDRLADAYDAAGRLADAADAARRALELAESRVRRRQLESLADRLRASAGDESAERALAGVLRVLEPPAPPPLEIPEPAAEAEAEEAATEPEPVAELEPEPEPEVEPEPEEEPEPVDDALVRAAEGEAALITGDLATARAGLLAAARVHRQFDRPAAAIDACYLALAAEPSDPDLHLLLVELYLDRGWKGPATDKLLLLGRLASLADDDATRRRLCAVATERLPNEPRLASLCA